MYIIKCRNSVYYRYSSEEFASHTIYFGGVVHNHFHGDEVYTKKNMGSSNGEEGSTVHNNLYTVKSSYVIALVSYNPLHTNYSLI